MLQLVLTIYYSTDQLIVIRIMGNSHFSKTDNRVICASRERVSSHQECVLLQRW